MIGERCESAQDCSSAQWTKAQPETGLINFDLLEPGHRCKIAPNREAELARGRRGTMTRDPFERLKEKTFA